MKLEQIGSTLKEIYNRRDDICVSNEILGCVLLDELAKKQKSLEELRRT